MQLPDRYSSFASCSELSKTSRELIMDGLFPLAAVRFSSLVNSFKQASMVGTDSDYKSLHTFLIRLSDVKVLTR